MKTQTAVALMNAEERKEQHQLIEQRVNELMKEENLKVEYV